MLRVFFVVVAAALVAAKIGDPCSFTSNGGTQDADCDVTAPYCTWTPTSGAPVSVCTPCRVRQPGDPCSCDATTSYCEQGGATPGTCQPYTRLNRACTSDADCITYTNAIVGGGLPLKTQNVRNEILSCVFGSCKPCDPDTWPKYYAKLDKPYVCPGYSVTASVALDRYAAGSSRPGTSMSCNVAGALTAINSNVNYSYGYSGDWTQWTPPKTSGGGGSGGGKHNATADSGAAIFGAALAAHLLALLLVY